jgi:hypothetical protein
MELAAQTSNKINKIILNPAIVTPACTIIRPQERLAELFDKAVTTTLVTLG